MKILSLPWEGDGRDTDTWKWCGWYDVIPGVFPGQGYTYCGLGLIMEDFLEGKMARLSLQDG